MDPTVQAALIGAVVTGAGFIIKGAVDRAQGISAAKRTDAARAYLEAIAAAEIVFENINECTVDKDALQQALLDLARASAAVDVFGSVEAARALHRLWNYVVERSVDEYAAMTTEWEAGVSQRLRDLTRDFRDVARDHLELERIGAPTADLDTREGRSKP